MKDFDIDNAIESADSERKAELLVQLHTRIGNPQHSEQQIKSRKRFFNVKAAAFGVAGIFAVSLAIVLPMALNKNTPYESPHRYTYNASQFEYDDLGLTIKEYSAEIGKTFLYIDWYDYAEECITTKYFLSDDADNIIYIAEDIYNGETGDHVQLAFVDTNIDVDRLDDIKASCTKNYEYNNTIINWTYDSMSESRAFFEYDGYKYYLRLFDPMSEQAILDIVKEML